MNDEFILTNRLGGYSSYSLSEGNTRKYHGILIASIQSVERRNIIPALIEKIYTDSEIDFSGNYFRDKKTPAMLPHIKRAFFLPEPTQIYNLGQIKIIKTLSHDENENKASVNYIIESPITAKLEIAPLFTLRDFHQIGLELNINDMLVSDHKSMQTVKLDRETEVNISTNGIFQIDRNVSHDHFYPMEELRGYDAYEDLLILGKYTLDIKPGKQQFQITFDLNRFSRIKRIFTLAANIISPSDNNSLVSDISRFTSINKNIDPSFSEFLVYNARKFIINEDERYSLIAGYHWFGEWSRDTFISFKGLLLGLGRFHEAQRVLIDWSKYIAIGLLPNQIQGMHFNSIDGVLWYVVAVWQYWQATQDKETVLHLLPKLERIIYALARGTKYGIGIEENGFLIWTDESHALTWMDAIVDKKPVVQRAGACVEIQALWYNCLQIIETLAKNNNYQLVNLPLFDELEKLLEANFDKKFWLDNEKYYADFIDLDNLTNKELRPNQLMAYSLPFILGDKQKFSSVIKAVEEKLLTPAGLRSLSVDSPQYIAEYKGDQKQRDLAYHQGPVWTWLLIIYYNALINTAENNDEVKEKIKKHLLSAWEVIKEKQTISVPEMFSGETLEPAGTVSQAWSTAALIEGIMLLHENQKRL